MPWGCLNAAEERRVGNGFRGQTRPGGKTSATGVFQKNNFLGKSSSHVGMASDVCDVNWARGGEWAKEKTCDGKKGIEDQRWK